MHDNNSSNEQTFRLCCGSTVVLNALLEIEGVVVGIIVFNTRGANAHAGKRAERLHTLTPDIFLINNRYAIAIDSASFDLHEPVKV